MVWRAWVLFPRHKKMNVALLAFFLCGIGVYSSLLILYASQTCIYASTLPVRDDLEEYCNTTGNHKRR